MRPNVALLPERRRESIGLVAFALVHGFHSGDGLDGRQVTSAQHHHHIRWHLVPQP